MKINTEKWKYFNLNKLFTINAGIYHYKDEYSSGSTPYCSATAMNNGVAKKINLPPDFDGNKIITGKVGCTAFYQKDPFCATSDCNILTPKFAMNEYSGLFIVNIININENFRWNYGRQCRVNNTKKIRIKLPTKINSNGKYELDDSLKFSKDGYIPDFNFMENFIKSLNHEIPKTKNKRIIKNVNATKWKTFKLTDIFNVKMGNGIDAINITNENPIYNYITRNGNDNGVLAVVDKIDNETPFPAGDMTLALGGSLGNCFVQDKSFYTAQNVGVLHPKTNISLHAKLFIATIIKNECKIKYSTFGRELNSHFRKDFTLKLPIVRDEDGNPVIDSDQQYSQYGYIPDFDFMEQYIKQLPNGDILK